MEENEAGYDGSDWQAEPDREPDHEREESTERVGEPDIVDVDGYYENRDIEWVD